MAKKRKSEVDDIIQRRDEAQKYMKQEIWGEVTEVWRGIKCRRAKVYKKDAAGKPTTKEDKSRTNVAMPTLSTMFRHNVARMVQQPYRLRYIGGDDPVVPEQLSSLSMQQYDRTDEAIEDEKLVMAGEGFGWGYMDLFWDKIAPMVKMRKALVLRGKVAYRNRASIMQAQGAGVDEIQGAVDELGEEMNDEEVALAMAKVGKEIIVPTEVRKYEGPVAKWVFNGDAFIEPGKLSINDSSFWIKQYQQTDVWLVKQSALTYKDEETGEEVPVFDEDCIKELLDEPSSTKQRQDQDLRDMMLAAVGRHTSQNYRFPASLEVRKKYDIIEQHAQDAEGRVWVTWISEQYRDRPLGKMPYQADFGGKFSATEYIPMPDMITCYGDATPRLLRYLYEMHNRTVAQNFDYVSNAMKKFLLKLQGIDVANEVIDRGTHRELEVENMNGIKYLEEPSLPPGAMNREAQQLQMMSMAEPSMTNVDAGTASNPQAGKTATTAILGAKKQDALTQWKVFNRDRYLRDLAYKKLAMNQQMATETWEIGGNYFSQGLSDQIKGFTPEQKFYYALSERGGKAASIKLDPLEIQEDYQIQPEAGSYLAVDDEIRRSSIQDLQQVAMANPGIIDQRKVARLALGSIRNIGNPDDYLLPEQTGPTPPEPKLSMSITWKGEDVPADIMNQILPAAGMQPSQELAHRDTLKGIQQVGEAANTIDDITAPETTQAFIAQSKKEDSDKKLSAKKKVQ